jgi:hypothetical protein
MSSRMMAVSRRAVKSLPSHAFSTASVYASMVLALVPGSQGAAVAGIGGAEVHPPPAALMEAS